MEALAKFQACFEPNILEVQPARENIAKGQRFLNTACSSGWEGISV